MARIFRRLAQLLDVDTTGVADGDALVYDDATETWVPAAGGGGGGAPTNVNYLVGTASSGLSAEIVVGTSPGGEFGGTWASPTVDATHSGSSHAGVQAAAEATAAAALAAHTGDTTDAHDASAISFAPAGGLAADDVQEALVELDTEKAAAVHAHAGEDITSGTVADARIASSIARDSEVTSAISALSTVYQPLDSDLTAVAALTTTSFGRGLLELANQAALLAAAGAAAASHAHSGADITSGTVAEARIHADIARDSEVTSAISALSSVYQPLDSDLTAIAALTTTSFGRSLLAMADAAAVRAALDLEAGTDFPSLSTFNDHSARHEDGGADEISLAGLSGEPADTVNKSLYDAHTVLAATSDNTPAAITMAASTFLARLASGNIKAASVAEILTLLDVPTNAQAILDALLDAKGDLIVASAADTPARLAVGTNGHVLTADSGEATGVKWAAAAGGSVPFLHYEDQKSSGTNGGTFTSGAWQTRDLNTEVADTGSIGSVSSNQITLPAGTYECDIKCPAQYVGNHQARLQNITDAATLLLGTVEFSNNGGAFAIGTSSHVMGRFTLAATKTLEVQHRCGATNSNVGFGSPGSWGTEVYTVAIFRKVA